MRPKRTAWFRYSQCCCPVSGVVAPPLCMHRVLPYAGGFAVYDGWRDVIERLADTADLAAEAVAAVHRGWFERFQQGVVSYDVYCRERADEAARIDGHLLQVSVAAMCAIGSNLRGQRDRYSYCLVPDLYHVATFCPFAALRYPPRCRRWLLARDGKYEVYDADADLSRERFERLDEARERVVAIHHGWFDAHQVGGEIHDA